MLAAVSALVAFAPFFALLLYYAVRRGKPCPDCGEPLPTIQSPWTKTPRQWVEGGYLCPTCGCEADMSGEEVEEGTPPQRGSIVGALALLTLAAAPGVVLLSLVLLG